MRRTLMALPLLLSVGSACYCEKVGGRGPVNEPYTEACCASMGGTYNEIDIYCYDLGGYETNFRDCCANVRDAEHTLRGEC